MHHRTWLPIVVVGLAMLACGFAWGRCTTSGRSNSTSLELPAAVGLTSNETSRLENAMTESPHNNSRVATARDSGPRNPTPLQQDQDGVLRDQLDRRVVLGAVHANVEDQLATQSQSSADELATNLQPWIDGWTDGFAVAADEAQIHRVQRVMELAICDPSTRELELLVLLRMLTRMSHVTSDMTLECAVSRCTSEDPVLWAALDLWRASRRDMGRSEAIAGWRLQARDPRTLRRLGLITRNGTRQATNEEGTQP